MASVEQKDSNTYIVTVSAGRGRKVKRNWHPRPEWSAKTVQRELQKFAADLENQLESGALQTRSERVAAEAAAKAEAAKIRTLTDYVNSVYMPAKAVTVSENTRTLYSTFLRLHILPKLGDCFLPEISSAQLSALILDFQKTHAVASCIQLYALLGNIFQMAFLDESIQQNPMLRVKRPKARKDEQEKTIDSYTAQEMKYIFQCLENEPLKWRVFVHLCADSACRRGEAAALTWSDIDFKSGTVSISKNLQYTSAAGIYIDTPKNGKSRVVDIGDSTLKLLRQLRRQQAEQAQISEYIFTQDNSPSPMCPQAFTVWCRQFGKRYGIANFHPHILRHTAASLSIIGGADIVSVSERLGHSSPALTLKVYSHATAESVRAAGDILRAALDKAENE